MDRLTVDRRRRLTVVVIAAAIIAEVVCRFGLGLGDPPLVVRDPHCGYRFAPSQTVTRFGNTISYDQRSRRGRSHEVDSERTIEVLLVGDSVLNGGALTDDADTADSLLNGLGFTVDGKRAVFRNLSAGSWAPPQQLAYLKAYGVGEAQAIILVLSSHDALSRHTGPEAPFPSRKPWLAAEEFVWRYVFQQRRHLFDASQGWEASAAAIPTEIAASPNSSAISCWCLAQICDYCAERKLPLAAVLWPSRIEATANKWDPTCKSITDVLTRNQIQWIDLLPTVRDQPDFAASIYRDDIHPTIAGQRVVAGGSLRATLRLFNSRP